MQFALTTTKSNKPLNTHEHLGKHYLVSSNAINSSFVTDSLSNAIEVATGNGDGSKEKPILDLELGELNFMTVEGIDATPFTDGDDPVDQPVSGNYKLITCDNSPSWELSVPPILVPSYAANLKSELKELRDQTLCILKADKSYCSTYKVGDLTFVHSNYSQQLFASECYEIIDLVNVEYLYENRNIAPDKYSYFIARKK